jgi:hypothetical protein
MTMKKACVLVFSFVALLPVSAMADDDTLAEFKGAVGVHPVSNVAGTQNADGTFPNVTRNVVRGVNPAGQLWDIGRFNATVTVDGQISADGRGLLLAGGNSVGTRAAVTTVRATLICETVAPFTLRDSELVPLEVSGDFKVNGPLSPWPPDDCSSPVLLIRNAGGTWFAAGFLKQRE